jgi:hypothetical protein
MNALARLSSLSLAAALLACGFAEGAVGPCKNHFILDDPCDPVPLLAPETFRIRQLYSSQDGEYQFIELEDTARTGIARLAGVALSVTDRRGNTKTLVLPSDLASAQPGASRIAIASQAFDEELREDWPYSGAYGADYTMPARFLPTDGGTIVLPGADQWTFERLPTDGATSLLRSGDVLPAHAATYGGGEFAYYLSWVWVPEFYHNESGRYFITGSEPELDWLLRPDSGWLPTGHGFWTRSMAKDDLFGQPEPVCRFRTPKELGDSQLFVLGEKWCELVASEWPTLTLETSIAFYAWRPDGSGACPPNRRPAIQTKLWPLFKLHRDTNELRYTGNRSVRDQFEREGWVVEGLGADPVAMCVVETY